ncbi:MAG: hypothetical protein ABIJ09_23890 [Pseudomonadota bacterium]
MNRRLRWGLAFGSVLLTSAFSAGCNPCEDLGDVYICGTFGNLSFATELGWGGPSVQWPPVATDSSSVLLSNGQELTEVDPQGLTTPAQFFDGTVSAPSLDSDGRVYLVQAGWADTQVVASGPHGPDASVWTQPVGGDISTTPPTIGNGQIHVALTSPDRSAWSLLSLDADSGEVTTERDDTSPTAVAADGSLRYLVEAQDCGASYNGLVAEDPDGSIRWRHDEPMGIRDFAPGPDGETYLVTGDRVLRRVGSDGSAEWSFAPDCADCNVAAAPTVTDDALYFPVWQGFAQNGGCNEETPPMGQDSLDPLYALRRDGSLMWVYDGFETMANRHNSGDPTGGLLMLSMNSKVRHHPAGRPTIADDGTLFVACDGAVVALSPEGKELGYAMYQPSAGENRTSNGLLLSSTFNNAVFTPAPMLAPSGSLYVWDGMMLRGFDVGKPAARIPWNAPFGGYRNAGRVGG